MAIGGTLCAPAARNQPPVPVSSRPGSGARVRRRRRGPDAHGTRPRLREPEMIASAIGCCDRPLRWFIGLAGNGADAQHAQPMGAAGEHATGAGVDPYEVVGIEREWLVL